MGKGRERVTDQTGPHFITYEIDQIHPHSITGQIDPRFIAEQIEQRDPQFIADQTSPIEPHSVIDQTYQIGAHFVTDQIVHRGNRSDRSPFNDLDLLGHTYRLLVHTFKYHIICTIYTKAVDHFFPVEICII